MHLLQTHQRICPEEIFRENPACSLRQLILEKVVTELRKDRRVVIDDNGWSYTKRDSFLSLIKRKVTKCNFLCINFHAQYGKQQILTSREFQLAEAMEMHSSVEHVNMGVSDALIDIWIKYEAKKEIGLTDLPTPDKPRETEGYIIKDIDMGLMVQSKYQFEVPALFIQWEGIGKPTKDGHVKLPTNATKTLNMWYRQYPCGRIIIIWDGLTTGSVSITEKGSLIRYLLTEIAKELENCVVYLLHIEDNSLSGRYTSPPNPGVLIFLQRLHLVDFNHRGTMYLYQSNNHQKMAEKVGVKHIRASRVFEHPHLVISGHGCTKCVAPEVLVNIKVIPPEESRRRRRLPEVPLYEDAKEGSQNIFVCQTPQGRALYIAFKDRDVLVKYNKEYSDNASEVGSGESKLAKMVIESQQAEVAPSTSGHKKYTKKRSSSGDKTRSVPEWMHSKSKKQKIIQSLVSSSESPEESVRSSGTKKQKMQSKSSRTIYIMSDTELVETAKSVLREAGRPIPQATGSTAHPTVGDVQPIPEDTQKDADLLGADTVPITGQAGRSHIGRDDNSSSGNSTHDQLLQDLFGFNEGAGARVKAPPKKRSSKDKNGKVSYQDISSDEEDKGDTEALLDELLGSGRRVSHRHTAPSAHIGKGDNAVFRVPDTSSSEEYRRQRNKFSPNDVSDSFVEETSSSKSRSSKTSLIIPDSFVSDTSSSRSKSLKPSCVIPDSFVSETSSSRSKSLKPSYVIPDSFVSETSSSRSKSLKPSYVIPDSFVSETSRSTRTSRSSASTVPDSFVKDSSSQRSSKLSSSSVKDLCIDETPPNSANKSHAADSNGKENSSYRVPETITTVPETALDHSLYKTS